MKHSNEHGFLYAHRNTVDGAWELQPYALSHHELVVVTQGAQRVESGGNSYDVPAGHAVLIPSGRARRQSTAEASKHLSYIAVGFRWSGYEAGMPLVIRDERDRLQDIATWLFAERHARSGSSAALREQLLHAFVSEYQRISDMVGWKRAETSPPSAVVETIRRFVQAHINEPFSLDDLATQVNMSKYYFARAYRNLTGLSPMDHARLMRLERARELVLSTNLPLKVIAPRVGFASEFHLSRLLRCRLGIGARELRARGGERPARPIPELPPAVGLGAPSSSTDSPN